MKTTPEALKALYAAMGGQPDDTYADIDGGAEVKDYTVTPDLIEAVTKAWSAAAEVMYTGLTPVVVTVTQTDATTGTTDYTADEIDGFFQDGRKIIIKAINPLDESETYFTLLTYGRKIEGDDHEYSFAAVGVQEPDGILTEIYMPWSVAGDNTVYVKYYQLTAVE